MTIHTISIRELRPKLPEVLDKIRARFDRFIVSRRGQPQVVILSIEDYESLVESLEIAEDRNLMRSIRQAESEIRRGKKGKSWEQVKKGLGLV
jgi:prevent-host-death family protein